ncbi:M20/M25/M40 family metallo-hydrolase [Paracoccus pantotrophus]|uniref:M20/M25/M40 family metallo-hydrolase n=1 Tax=Paracoccus pantotrophus TaxID=82367 RepID=A0AAE6TVQ9_PARPN|nr:M20/M25/M40 family metallo-hydrolase [Paracoccus pantotrophus]RDD98910.1 M20/M25/M40 family metallo-hydrolase [Paracoccus pantotrophus]RNI19216.1 M20/M25/M40 family metallo-hydrolase [Paracoccus pantotrophus]WGR65756.1 M20/M25/M40 family metallo-hydrolase [Paracoccus pantotrophus]
MALPRRLSAGRAEDASLPTVLIYGHGEVVTGVPEKWPAGLPPFRMTERDGCWHGRGTADTKGRHSVNFTARKVVLAVNGKLGFDLKGLMFLTPRSFIRADRKMRPATASRAPPCRREPALNAPPPRRKARRNGRAAGSSAPCPWCCAAARPRTARAWAA